MQVVLTHFLAKHPGLGFRIDFHQHRGRADKQDHQVGHAEVHQEDVGGVPHVFCLEYHNGHHHVAHDSDPQDNETEHHRRDADVSREHRHLAPRAQIAQFLREIGAQERGRRAAVSVFRRGGRGNESSVIGRRCINRCCCLFVFFYTQNGFRLNNSTLIFIFSKSRIFKYHL